MRFWAWCAGGKDEPGDLGTYVDGHDVRDGLPILVIGLLDRRSGPQSEATIDKFPGCRSARMIGECVYVVPAQVRHTTLLPFLLILNKYA